MNAEERLNICQDQLVAKGVRDVKFYFNNSPSSPLSTVASDAADLLETVLDGKKHKTANPIGDGYGLDFSKKKK
jgi:hypothetical protein